MILETLYIVLTGYQTSWNHDENMGENQAFRSGRVLPTRQDDKCFLLVTTLKTHLPWKLTSCVTEVVYIAHKM